MRDVDVAIKGLTDWSSVLVLTETTGNSPSQSNSAAWDPIKMDLE